MKKTRPVTVQVYVPEYSNGLTTIEAFKILLSKTVVTNDIEKKERDEAAGILFDFIKEHLLKEVVIER